MFLQSLNVFKEESFSITSDHLPIKPNFDDILLRIHIPKLSACHEATPETIVKYRNEVERRLLN